MILSTSHVKIIEETSLVVQWLKICLPMQDMGLIPVQEDSTTRGATTEPMPYSICAAKNSPHLLQLEKSLHTATKAQCNKQKLKNLKIY